MTHVPPENDEHEPRPVQWDKLTPEVQHQIVQNAEVVISGRKILAAFLAFCAALGTVAATMHYGTAAYRDWFGLGVIAHGSKVLATLVTTLAVATGIAIAVASTAEAPGIRVHRERSGARMIWRQADTFPAVLVMDPTHYCRRHCK